MAYEDMTRIRYIDVAMSVLGRRWDGTTAVGIVGLLNPSIVINRQSLLIRIYSRQKFDVSQYSLFDKNDRLYQ